MEREDERVRQRNDGVLFAPPRTNFGFRVFRRSHRRSCEMDERGMWERNGEGEWKSEKKKSQTDIKPEW